MQSLDMPSQQSDIDKFLLCAAISSIGVPSSPRTLDTTQALLRQELKNRLIHKGTRRGARIPDIKTIQRKGIKRTHGAKYEQDDGTEDSSADDEDAKDSGDTDNEDAEDDVTEGGDTGMDDAEIKGAVLGIEASLDLVIHGQSETETWSSQEYQPSGLKKRLRPPMMTKKEFQHLFYTIQYHLHHKLKPHLPFNISAGSQYWSAEFTNSPIPGKYNCQKPNIVLFDFTLKNTSKTWADVLSFVEHTSSDLAKKQSIPVFWESVIKAYLMLREQPWHQFIVGFSICANQLRAHYFDRSGVLHELGIMHGHDY
ncbi:hypothetical protein F4604DRAFT_1923294 [Suillus subluteus]|nr:hypothetical protein F4604DRAFT_1923294 [Suillus subluteus]